MKRRAAEQAGAGTLGNTGEHWGTLVLTEGQGTMAWERSREITLMGMWREQCHESQVWLSHGEINKKAKHTSNSCVFWALTAYQSLCCLRYRVSFDPCALDGASEVQWSHGTYQGHRARWRNRDLNPGLLGYKAHVLNSAGVKELLQDATSYYHNKECSRLLFQKADLKNYPVISKGYLMSNEVIIHLITWHS